MIENINIDSANVSAELHGFMYDSIYGYNTVLKYGNELKCEIVSNNEVILKDGLLCNHGRYMRILGTESIPIENGKSGVNRTDLIVAHFETDGITETHDIRVIKGEDDGSLPTYTTGNIYNGDNVNELPLYAIHLIGLNIAGTTKMFIPMCSINELRNNVVNPNLLINSDFRKPVNLRGQTLYQGQTAKGYTVDRWCMGDQDYNRTVEVVSNVGVKITNPNTEYIGTFQQIFEQPYPQGDYTVTVKVVEKSGGGTVSCDGSQTDVRHDLKLGINTFTFNDATINSVRIYLAPSSSLTIEYIKLEVGTVATPFSPRPYNETMEMCKRFYDKETIYMPMMYSYSATKFKFGGNFMKQKRGTPTIIAGNIFAYDGNNSQINPTAIEFKGTTSEGTMVDLTFSKALDDGASCVRATITLDAEIY